MRTIVTGATGAIGAAAVEALAREGRTVIMACRNLGKAEKVAGEIRGRVPDASLEIMELDLGSLESVRRFAASIEPGTVSALFNNAGVISKGYSLTVDGLENSFAVNYYGPWLLTNLLLEKMPEDACIVNMVSLTTRFVGLSLSDLTPGEKDFRQLKTYARSKRALISFSCELARRHPSLQVHMADPGIVASDMIDLGHWYDPIADAIFKPFCRRPSEGARPALNALRYGAAAIAPPDRTSAAENGRPLCWAGKGSREVPRRYLTPELDLAVWGATEEILQSTSR